ncbi:MAG: DNA-binding protein [Zetaproteobacteria bacterium CG2_30_46_52]|nr:MAG: DNA-binding protein [Zetaproteobacteria bacterium CG2_30_46_52]
MSHNVSIINSNELQSKIFTIRGLQVMMDRDLAELYGVKAIRLREQVKRNIGRFPDDFMFQLTLNEVEFMVSQNAIPSKQHLGGSLPYVFTEAGVSMLASILKSETAVNMSVQIIRAFVGMRKFISNNAAIFQRLDNIEQKQYLTDTKLDKVFEAIEAKDIKPAQGIFFDGQVFDAYVFVADLIKSAKKSIVLIDNYIAETTLTMLTKRKAGCTATIYTHTVSKKLQLDVQKHNEQYPTIEIKTYKQSHDRFLILDEHDVYHFGASLKDLGKKWFAFSKFDKGALEVLGKLGHE